MGITERNSVSQLSLPPGFRFHPTDEELLVHYLCRKVAGYHFTMQIIGEVDLYKFDPWLLPSQATFGEKEWYFFTPRDRKYPNGSRPNRVAGTGYWKATGTDKIITSEGRKVGIKKALVFYIGKAPKGTKTNWIMHEYRLSETSRKNGSSRLDDWVLCRLYKKNSSTQKQFSSTTTEEPSHSSCSTSAQFDDVLGSLPDIDDQFFALPRMNSLKSLQDEKLKFQNSGAAKFDWDSLAVMGSMPELVSNGQPQRPEMYFPSVTPVGRIDSPSDKFGSSIEEEVESRFGSQQVNNSSFFQQNSNLFAQSSELVNPVGIGYPTPTLRASGLYGFVQ